MKLPVAGIAASSTIAFLFAATSASAVPTFSLLDSSTQGTGNMADIFAADFGASTPAGAVWSGGASVVTPPPGNVANAYQSPFNNTALLDSQDFFTVGAPAEVGGAGSSAALTFDAPQTSFDILWGSIDSYNTIEFLDAAGASLASFTGADIVSQFGLGGSGPNFEQVALLRLSADIEDAFTTVAFSSSQPSFEFGLAGLSVVPVPATVWLLLTAMFGLGFVSRRRNAS